MLLKRDATSGTRRENPARTQNAAAKPIHGGPVVRASAENEPAATRKPNPVQAHVGESSADCSIIEPARSACTGSMFAAALAGSHAAMRTETSPSTAAVANIHGVTAT